MDLASIFQNKAYISKKYLITISTSVICVLAAYFLGNWWFVSRFIESTNNAYVRAEITRVSSQVEGYVQEVFVKDNQKVNKKDILAIIQPEEFQARLSQGQANLKKAESEARAVTYKISLQESIIKESKSDLDALIADSNLAKRELERAKGLVKENAASIKLFDKAVAEDTRAKARVEGAKANHTGANKQKEILEIELSALNAEISQKSSAVDLLEISLSRTQIRAPISGFIGNRLIRVGQFVRPGTHLLAIVPDKLIWIEANFKETQLKRIKKGQQVRMKVDSYPNEELFGRVESLAPASGAEFSLLPPENATGNFSKIVQRIPIKIFLEEGFITSGRFKPGMSVTVEVNTKNSK